MKSVIDKIWADAAKFGWPAIENKKAHYDAIFRQQIEEAYHDGVYDGWCIDNNAGIRLHDSPHDYFTKKINDENSNAGIDRTH